MARGLPAAHSCLDPPVSADRLAGCRIMRIGVVGATVVRGMLAALLLTAVPLAAPGPVVLHAFQPPQQPPAEQPDAEQPTDAAEAETPAGTFEAPAGLVLSYIKREGSGDFERVMTSLGAALAGSEDEALRELLAGWRLYRAQEPGPEGEVLYVWLIDPAVAGADYAVPELLGEALPHEAQALFDAFSEAFGSGQALINLEPVDLRSAAPE